MKTLMSALALSIALVACGGGTSTTMPSVERAPDPDVQLLEATWASESSQGQDEICVSYILHGSKASYVSFLEGFGKDFPYRTFTEFFDRVCL